MLRDGDFYAHGLKGKGNRRTLLMFLSVFNYTIGFGKLAIYVDREYKTNNGSWQYSNSVTIRKK